jgi:transcription termination/antitermination protein NusA
VLVDDETKEATVIVPDDQLSLAIGREGQNARLAAKLTGWKVDIKSETEFSHEEELEYEEAEEADGRCAAVLSAGRRCPNAALEGSRYCGLPQHQALARFDTNHVTVLAPLTDEEVAKLADSDVPDDEAAPLVERAKAEFSEEAEAEAEPAEQEAEDEAEPAEQESEAEAGGEEAAAEVEEVAADEEPEQQEAEAEAPKPDEEAEVAGEQEAQAEAEAAAELAEAEEEAAEAVEEEEPELAVADGEEAEPEQAAAEQPER